MEKFYLTLLLITLVLGLLVVATMCMADAEYRKTLVGFAGESAAQELERDAPAGVSQCVTSGGTLYYKPAGESC